MSDHQCSPQEPEGAPPRPASSDDGSRRGYRTGSIRPHAAGGWEIRWRENGRQRSQVIRESREVAARTLAKHLGNVASTGRSGAPKPARETGNLAGLADDWLTRRDATHRNAAGDRRRWKRHLEPWLGRMRPAAVTPALIRQLIERKLGEGLNSSSVRLIVALLSTLFSDLAERELVHENPVKRLPRATRKLIRPAHDPKDTPWLKRAEDVRTVFLALPEPYNVAFAIGAMAGLRTGEVRALQWQNVDEASGLIYVRESVQGKTKDLDSRVVPIMDQLRPVLTQWRLRTGGTGLVIPPVRQGRYLDDHSIGRKLRKALEDNGLWVETDQRAAQLNWYRCTRHTFASHYVAAGGTLETLKEIMGHSSFNVTLRYAHLLPGAFSEADRRRVAFDLSPASGTLIPLRTGSKKGRMRDEGQMRDQALEEPEPRKRRTARK
jgi:integrase